jgi:iron complex outermembrane receptor protein
MSYKYALLCATALLAASTITLPAHARTEPVVDEVLVTARKREERLQDVPLAVTSVTGEQLQQAGVQTPLTLGRLVPNLQTRGYPGSASIVTFSIRGQKAGDVLSTFDQAVGIYVDGVYIARPRGTNGAFFDLERVEVLKGPQGTLYGRNTTGGAVNFISRDADYNGVHGFLGVDVGSFELVAPRAAVNIPIVEGKLAVRLGYQGTFREGFGRSAVTGQRIGQDRDQNLYRGTVVFDPTPGLNFELKAEHYRSRENGNLLTYRGFTPNGTAAFAVAAQAGITPAAATALLNSLGAARNSDFDTTWAENPQRDLFTGTTIGLTTTAELAENVQLKSITGYRRFTNDQLYDLDGTEFRLLQIGVGRFPEGPEVRGAPGLPATAFQQDPGPEQRAVFFSQEFNLSGAALGDRLNWLGGVYYSHELGNDTQHAQALPPLLANSFIYDGSKILNQSWSVYTQNDFQVTEQLTLTVGGRYTEEQKYLTSLARNFFPNGAAATATAPAIAPNSITCLTGVAGIFPAADKGRCYVRNENTWTGTSWLAGLSYQASEDVLIYGRAAQGFRGGTFQLRSPLLAPANLACPFGVIHFQC